MNSSTLVTCLAGVVSAIALFPTRSGGDEVRWVGPLGVFSDVAGLQVPGGPEFEARYEAGRLVIAASCAAPDTDCAGETDNPPTLIRIMDGIATHFGAPADTFILPSLAAVPLDRFTLQVSEPVLLDEAQTTYTATGPAPVVTSFTHEGDGRYTVTLDPPPQPGAWLKVVLEVTGVQSAHDSDIVLWLAQLPGDVDQDGQVSVRDATVFGQAFAERESLLIDLNGDGRVDVRDATTFGAIWRGAPPATRPWNSSRLPDKPE